MNHELTTANSGSTTVVAPGDHVVLNLPENGTTGYQWEFSAPDGWITGNDYTPMGDAPGAGGKRTVRLTPKGSGSFHVKGALRRSWESADQAAEHVDFTIEVR